MMLNAAVMVVLEFSFDRRQCLSLAIGIKTGMNLNTDFLLQVKAKGQGKSNAEISPTPA